MDRKEVLKQEVVVDDPINLLLLQKIEGVWKRGTAEAKEMVKDEVERTVPIYLNARAITPEFANRLYTLVGSDTRGEV